MNTTYEEAKKCPKCHLPGQEASRVAVTTGPNSDIRPGTKAATIFCRNDRCRWFNTCWIVQINPDGTVPIVPEEVRRAATNKQYPRNMPPEMIQRAVDALNRQAAAETQAGAEIQNR